jgi:hypothetical protein
MTGSRAAISTAIGTPPRYTDGVRVSERGVSRRPHDVVRGSTGDAIHAYEFFLLRRPPDGGPATIIRKWLISSDTLPYEYYLRGVLEYDPTTRMAVVRAIGESDGRVFLEERVPVSGDGFR